MKPKMSKCKSNADDREAQLLRQRRLELGFSQQEVATEVGLQIRQYQRFEYGERKLSNANLKLGLRVCAALELEPYDFAFENGKDMAIPKKKR